LVEYVSIIYIMKKMVHPNEAIFLSATAGLGNLPDAQSPVHMFVCSTKICTRRRTDANLNLKAETRQPNGHGGSPSSTSFPLRAPSRALSWHSRSKTAVQSNNIYCCILSQKIRSICHHLPYFKCLCQMLARRWTGKATRSGSLARLLAVSVPTPWHMAAKSMGA
jgi:hypothetical protein